MGAARCRSPDIVQPDGTGSPEVSLRMNIKRRVNFCQLLTLSDLYPKISFNKLNSFVRHKTREVQHPMQSLSFVLELIYFFSCRRAKFMSSLIVEVYGCNGKTEAIENEIPRHEK